MNITVTSTVLTSPISRAMHEQMITSVREVRTGMSIRLVGQTALRQLGRKPQILNSGLISGCKYYEKNYNLIVRMQPLHFK